MNFYDYINDGLKYICDRCSVTELRFDEYRKNWNIPYHYCDECWNYINLKKWKCNKCYASGTHRSERLLPKTCSCGEIICLSR